MGRLNMTTEGSSSALIRAAKGPDRERVSADLLSALAHPHGAPRLKMYVDGSWRDAADGRTFESYEPATGRVWATVAEAGPEDVDAAVRAARRAFEGAWGSTRAMDRARVLYRIAEKIDAHKEELVRIESRDEHPGVDKIAFTGSTATGKRIAAQAAQTLKLVTCELGGKSPNIIFADADLEQAVNRSAYGIFSASGQSCMAASRTLVQASIHDEFVERFGAKAAAIRVGDPFDPATQVGATTSRRQLEKVQEYVALGLEEGARLAAGGAPPSLSGANAGR